MGSSTGGSVRAVRGVPGSAVWRSRVTSATVLCGCSDLREFAADAGSRDARGVDAGTPCDSGIHTDAEADTRIDAGIDAGLLDGGGADAGPRGPCDGQPAGTVCRVAAGVCDVAETCD